MDTLLKPENVDQAQKDPHLPCGCRQAHREGYPGPQIKAGNGKATLTTVEGGTLTAAKVEDGKIVLTDEKGGTADGLRLPM